MLSFFSRYFSSIHHVEDASEWLALCACEKARRKMLGLLNKYNACAFREARQCFLDGVQLGALVRQQEPDEL